MDLEDNLVKLEVPSHTRDTVKCNLIRNRMPYYTPHTRSKCLEFLVFLSRSSLIAIHKW